MKIRKDKKSPNKKPSKAQIRVKQMVFMLIAVTILIAMVGMFILMIRIQKIKNTASELEEQNAVLLASKLANSPEFSCGDAFGRQRSNCVDYDKFLILKENMERYENFWGVKNIELMIIYPAGDFRRGESLVLVEGTVEGKDASSFVSVCKKKVLKDKIQDVCTLGRLFVRYKHVE